MKPALEPHHHQDSPEWHAYRGSRGNASEVAPLMDCSPWFPRTPYELWLVKTGRASVSSTAAMRRGSRLEPFARAFAERLHDEIYEPQVVARGRISASLDGLSFDGRVVLEIKCPQQGRESATWIAVSEDGRPPEHYWWQVQQQLYCSGAERARFVVCHAENDEIVDATECTVLPDLEAHAAIASAWEAFFPYLDADTAPPQGERDVYARNDAEWRDAVAQWKESKKWLDAARAAEAEARQALIQLAGGQSTEGAGIRLKRYWKSGEIDWRKATAGMDLEPYRKAGGWHYRISEQD